MASKTSCILGTHKSETVVTTKFDDPSSDPQSNSSIHQLYHGTSIWSLKKQINLLLLFMIGLSVQNYKLNLKGKNLKKQGINDLKEKTKNIMKWS